MTNPFPYPQPSTAPAPGMEALLEPVAGVALAGDCREPGRLLAEVGRGQAEVPRGFWFNGRVELKHMFGVNKGDTVKLSVKAYYENDPIVDGMLSAAEMFAAILAGGEGGNVAGEGATLANSTLDESAVSAMNTNKSASSEEDVPKAFINYMLFDKDMTYITSGFIQISSGAKNLWETVEFPAPITIEQNGYALVYVSNETNAACVVDFDDLTIEHAKTPIVFASDYYPFGLEYNGFSRNYSQKVRFKFQDQESDEETGWIAFKWRNHQPEIGRFFNLDPLAEDYYYNSPYAFSENKLVGHVELEGLESLESKSNPYIRSLLSEPVQSQARKVNEESKDMITGSITVQGGGIGFDATIGPIQTRLHARTGSISFFGDSDGDFGMNMNSGNISAAATVTGYGLNGSITGPNATVYNENGDAKSDASLSQTSLDASGKKGDGKFSTSLLSLGKFGFGLSLGNLAFQVKADTQAFVNYIEESANLFSAYVTDVFDLNSSENRKVEEVQRNNQQ